MLLWINGPFGGGKSETARELHRRLPGSVICDPEELGFGLQRMLPAGLRSDFQDFAAWRQGVHEALDLILGSVDGPVIVPMTLIEAIAASAGLPLGRHRGTAVGDRLRWAGRGLRHALTR